jgi:hypothetical protein
MTESLEAALGVARRFLDALSSSDYEGAAAVVAPSAHAAFRETQLSSLTSWAQQRDAIIALQRGGGDGVVGFPSDGVYRPEDLARVADTPLEAIAGVRTLGEFAALPAADFLARYLDVSNPLSAASADAPLERPRYLVLGGVADGSDVVHVIYRCTNAGYHDPYHASVLRVVHIDRVWSVDIATAGHEIVNSSWLMMSMMQPEWRTDGPNADES